MSEDPRTARRKTLLARRSSLCVVLVAAALLTACSNNGNGSSAGSSKPAAVATVPTNSPAASSGGSGQTFNGHGVTFQYPSAWQSLQLGTKRASQGTAIWTETVGVNTASFATVAQYAQKVAITPSNIDQHTSELTTQIQSLFSQAGGSMQSGPTKLTLGGFPALGYSGTAVNPDAVSVKNRIILAFNGTTEYLVNCQSTGQSSSVIDTGCDQIISTFAVA